MRSLDRKLWRDLWGMRGQALAIALVISSGVATFVMSLSTLDSLELTRTIYYQEYRFGEVFASLKRAPEGLQRRIREIGGVSQVQTRVVAPVRLEIEGFPDPVTGHLVSIPDLGQSMLNRLYLRRGRFPEPGREDEVIASEAFADAHGFDPGDQLRAVVNGRRKTLTLVGIALSPEYIYQIGPGSAFPDFSRYGVLWMARTPLANAYDMEGAFNQVTLSLSAGAQLQDVIDRLDVLLEPYGGLGAYGRADQTSHHFLSEELRQLGALATVFPAIFLGVAAFLLNVVIGRLVSTQREQIAILKALGYGNLDIGLHYVKLVILVVLIGVGGGVGLGVWLGRGLSGIYMQFYRFPFMIYELRPIVVVAAALVSAGAAVLGTVFSVRAAVRLPPAEAMRPEPPAVYRESGVERLGVKRLLSQPSRMIVRHIGRQPVKSLLSVTGIAFACGIMMVGNFNEDAVDHMVKVQFGLAQREDLAVTFVEPTSRKALYVLQGLEGVEYGEVFRSVPVRLKFGHRRYRTEIQGFMPGGRLRRLLDTELRVVELPSSGIVLTAHLGRILGARPGDLLTVETLEGRRLVRQVPVAAWVEQYFGVPAYMSLTALNRLMREGNAVSGAYLAADVRHWPDLFAELREMPRVAGTVVRENAIRNFYETMAETVLFFTSIATLLGATIAFGVVYNSARIALSERNRELASLRVLGFTRGEISYVLLGELAVLTLAAVPLGFLVGRGLCAYLVANLQSDLYRVPLVLEPSTYAFSATVVLASAALSGLIVRRRLDRLDLVAVLKTRE